MSRAFVRESDELPDRPLLTRRPTALPAGTPNYVTADGAQRFREELEKLVQEQRPESKPRIAQLQQCLESAVVVGPPVARTDVQFGATVTVRDRTGDEIRYRIVGVDEVDLDRNWVSWLSPIAKTLLNAQLGQRVRFKFPSGEEELEVVAISYEHG